VTITDAIAVLRYRFAGAPIACAAAGDIDDTGSVEIDDAILLLAWMFFGFDAPPAPGPVLCGEDPTADDLDCDGAGCR
jgi:hypothetical protein